MSNKLYTFLLFVIICFSVELYAQVPVDVRLHNTAGSSLRACVDRSAGTVRLGTFIGFSNDISLERSFLCFNDRLELLHNGDGDYFESDPDPLTEPGIGYAWYTCSPTIPGPMLDDIFLDPCLLTDPTPMNGIYVYVDAITGDAIFWNGNQIGGQSIPDFLNNGAPVEVFFAPITIDAEINGQAQFEGNPAGECVQVNVDAAFSIVYLTSIRESTERIEQVGVECHGKFVLNGGLPEWDDTESYTITIEHSTQSGVFGTLIGSNYGHGDEVEFSVPMDGTYTITVEDGKSCARTFEMLVSCDGVIFDMSEVTATPGEIVCIDLLVSNFVDLESVSFDISWNPNMFEYVGVQDFDIPQDVLTIINDNNASTEGYITVIWVSPNNQFITLPDGSLFFRLCLRAIGDPGDMTVIDYPAISIDLLAAGIDGDVPFLFDRGKATIVFPQSLGAAFNVCPDDGSGSGSIKVTVYGGEPPYLVNYMRIGGPSGGSGSISDEGGMQNIEGLMEGTYNFMITDNLGTVIGRTINVPIGTAHDLDFVVTDPSCAYTDDGMIEMTINPPGDYEISWSTSQFNTELLRNLDNGPYSVTVTDNFGCDVNGSVTLNTEPIAITGIVSDASCRTSTDGGIFIEASGGKPISGTDYVYRWQGRNPVQGPTNNLTGQPMGWYYLTITDSENCFVSDSFFIDFENEVYLENVSIDSIECYGETGRIEIQVNTTNTLGDHDYVFDWVGQTGVNGPNRTSWVQNVEANTYSVRAIDFTIGLDCYLDTFFVLEEPDPIVIELLNMEPEGCNGDSSGVLEVTVQGGDDPFYTFQWDDLDRNTRHTGLVADTHFLTVWDPDFNCSIDTFFIVDKLDGPEILGYDSVSVSCGGASDGELIIYTDPSDATVEWRHESGTLYNTDTISAIPAGAYYITVISGLDCEALDTVYLEEAGDVRLDSVSYVMPTCPGFVDGSITVFVSGPSSDLSYEWSHQSGSDNPLLPSIGAGDYSVTITSPSSACPPVVIDTLRLEDPIIFGISFDDIQAVSCPGICNGVATAAISGATGSISYQWSSGETTETATQLCAGMNTVTITDDLCSDVFSVDIPSSDSIGLSATLVDPSCHGSMDGSISLIVSGGTSPYIFDWSDVGVDQPNRDLLAEGTYYVTISDLSSCERIDTFELLAPDSLIAQFLPSDVMQVSCSGRTDGSAAVSIAGGNPGVISYSWTPNVSSSESASDLGPGTYMVMVSDERNCMDTASFILDQPSGVLFSISDPNPIICPGETTAFGIDTVYAGAGGPYTFSVNSGASISADSLINLQPGEYLISIYDDSGCFVDTNLVILPAPDFELDLGPDITVTLGDSARLENSLIVSERLIDSMVWTTPLDDLSCYTCPAPWILPTTDQLVQLRLVDEAGCIAIDEMMVFVDAQRKVYIPTAFSPNSDNANDIFRVFTGFGVTNISSFQVFNRWGSLVFEGRNFPPSRLGSAGWDGTQNGKELNPDLFTYVIQVEFTDGETVLYTGSVQLVR